MPIDPTILGENANPYFVETGTYLGEGVASALAAGFEKIWTVDVDPERKAFEGHPKVVRATGDSALFLASVVPGLDKPATFWLDAHPVGYFDLLQPDLPLLHELVAISYSTRPSGDIILIDDLRLFEPQDQERLRTFIGRLWPGCLIDVIDSALIPQDILRIRFQA